MPGLSPRFIECGGPGQSMREHKYMTSTFSGVRHILIDADDTLWENNVYFERATEDFIDFLAHSRLSRAQVREVLNEFELINSREYGYGTAVYTRSLQDCYRHLAEGNIDDAALDAVIQFGRRILERDLELIPHVETTLKHLARTYVLTLCTKGDREEQQIKVDRSGLAPLFHQIEIMAEKDENAYSEILGRLGSRPEEEVMVGNSPKSDINPPLALGMAAVFIPHDRTWLLEHQEIDRTNPRLLVLERFADLANHF
jgi:putative hydrolase of the HAD superfamily